MENENQVMVQNYFNNNAATENINQGSVAIESSRAIAEAQGKLIIAKKFPRDEVQAFANMARACQRKGLAEKAFYTYPRGGSSVSGPTIRLAEELARCWCNMEYGIKELSQDNGKSELQAFAWDYENNVMSSQNFTNPHKREVGKKTVALTSIRDIYENNANMSGRRLRARILAVLPADFVEEAIKICQATLKGNSDIPLIDRVKKMTIEFEKIGVTQDMIEKRLKRKIDTMNADDFTDYVGIFNGLKGGNTKISDYFEYEKEATDLTSALENGK